MDPISVQKLVDCGVHFGCRISRWNPKMRPYIYGRRNSIHIIDLRYTVRGLLRATNFLRKVAQSGEQVLFVGTKRQVKGILEEQAKACEMPYVSERWIGGTLTNFDVIRRRLARLEELERMEADGSIEQYSKKMLSSFRREKRKITRNLEGIRTMTRIPGVMFIVDPGREVNAVREANKMGIPVVCLADTDCDPDMIDILIPANDDALKSVSLLLGMVVESIKEGRRAMDVEAIARAQAQPAESAQTEPRPTRRRRDGGRGGRGGGRGGPGGPRGGGRERQGSVREQVAPSGGGDKAEASAADKPAGAADGGGSTESKTEGASSEA